MRRLKTIVGKFPWLSTYLFDIVHFRLIRTKITRLLNKPESLPKRVIIGPANYAEQGYRWAKAIREHIDDADAINVHVPSRNALKYDFFADLKIVPEMSLTSRRWSKHFSAFVASASHVLYEAQQPFLGERFKGDFAAEINFLQKNGVSVASISHGSDIRLPSRHKKLNPWSPFHDESQPLEFLERNSRKNIDVLKRLEIQTFVATPDLLLDLPTARWLPTVISPSEWSAPSNLLSSHRLRVLHNPSGPAMKGTNLITPTLKSLEADGFLEFTLVEDIPHSKIIKYYMKTDVVLEQFRIGSYGVAAIEAMAAGRIVIAHITEQVREHIKTMTGLDLPIIEATPETLGATLLDITNNPENYVRIAAQGTQFVRQVHDGRLSAQYLNNCWLKTNN